MDDIRVVTNNVPRFILDAWELTEKERGQFDYINWEGIEEGTDSATFVRYHEELYDLGEFTSDYGILKGSGLPDHLSKWDGYMGESFFSAVVVRIVSDDQVIMGRVLT
jgi:hypothetical protein